MASNTNYPGGFRECWGDYRDEEDLEVSTQPLYAHQKSLPTLPVPTLEATCALYLQTVRPLATDAEFAATKKAVADFLAGPLGPALQKRLLERATARPNTSYLAEWWNKLGYLEVRDPVVFYVSYFFHFADAAHASQRSQVGRAASLLVATMDFRNQVATGTRPPEMLGRGKTPLCSTAYKYMFNACRIPHRKADSYRIYDPSTHHHVVVLRNNKYFKVHQPATPLSFLEWSTVLEKIIAIAGGKESSIGVLSSQDRDVWADGRDQLLVDGNEASLKDIESAVVVLCLDDETPVSRTEVSRALWHGNGRNRFYDKTIQLIVFENGKAGILAEHSMLDGMAMSVYADYILTGLRNQTINLGDLTVPHATLAARLPAVTQVPFNITRATLHNIALAEHTFDLTVDDHEVHVESFFGYGNALMKNFKCSPDAYVQMAIQLAARKFWGKEVATYEASQVRPYLHGRTETTRSCSIASKAFVDTMVSAAPLERLADKASLCRAACNSHVQYMKLAAQSKGVDRHFLGLRLLLQPGESAAIFEDPLFARSKYWQISTSHLTHELFDGWGWGEVVSDGVGIAYSIKKNSVHFNIACRKTIPLSMSRSFGHLLEESLLEMRSVFEADKSLELKAKL
ncbi:choline/Carnitine O-acyltransferase [Achlya hypogyna]|uniref:Choline/Carnitine O-acyltransferase n=1 Tax=Achlya hypogyna TaxID=1202772 RepID=A0A1V9YB81_ACHHY|nr:choline/Carnitine O-acyltransferase [Achlya hypogyna]